MTVKLIFWVFAAIIFYSYFGYTLILMLKAFFNRIFEKRTRKISFEPAVSLIIPAYNEAAFIERKMQNCREIEYPAEKLEIIWVTDGSTDESREILEKYYGIRLMHKDKRKGKTHAINRSLRDVDNDFVILTDANSMLNPESVNELVKPFADERVGCTAGEKRISKSFIEKAVSAGEGLYWRYESFVKKLESKTGSVLGAAGELFAIRKSLFKEIPHDTLLDDFTISMKIASDGYRVKYVPDAFSVELSSVSVKEELKRKLRIASGGIQFLVRNMSLLNPLKYGKLSFRYISHKVLRWIFVPFGLIAVFLLNLAIVCIPSLNNDIFRVLFTIQVLFYLMAVVGALLKDVKIRNKLVFVPFYMVMMNYAMVAGIVHYFKGKYSVNWPKAERQEA